MQTIDTRHWHERYAALDELAGEELAAGRLVPLGEIKLAVDDAWEAISDAFKKQGFKAGNSDDAEEVIAVLTRYLFRSNAGNGVMDHTALLIDARTL